MSDVLEKKSEKSGKRAPVTAGAGKVDLSPESGAERRVYWAVVDSANLVRRELLHYGRHPSYIAWQLGFPIISVLLYGYVFGGAMKPPGGGDYRDFLMPGMFVMTMAFGL
ncbi:ABC transporter permease, partial [Streptomyces sp. NPDC055078]